MTREQIEGLSGWELDGEIAEWVTHIGHVIRPPYGTGRLVYGPSSNPLYSTGPLDVPHYSTTWEGMALVVTRLTAMVGDDGDHLRVTLDIGSMGTLVTVGNPNDHPIHWHKCVVEGPPETAAPTAVARVALLVVAEE